MDIQRVGVSVPLSETPTESIAPKEAPHSQSIHQQPFQDDAVVSYSPPGLDLGSSTLGYPTSPAAPTGVHLHGDIGTPAQTVNPPDEGEILKNIQKFHKDSDGDVLNNIK